MNQIYEIAFSYYVHFYSFKGKFSKLWPWMLASAVTGILFIALGFCKITNIEKSTSDGLLFFWDMKWLLISESLFLVSLAKLKNKRNEIISKGAVSKSKNKKQQLILAKRNWLKINIGKNEYEYLCFAKDIKEMHALHIKYSREPEGFLKIIMKHIYSPEAKPRITSYVIYLMSLIALLSIKNSEGIQAVFSAFESSSYRHLFIFVMLLGSLFFYLSIGGVYLVRFLAETIDTTLSIATSSKRSSYRFVEAFIGDLITLHRLPKLKKTETLISQDTADNTAT